MSTFSHSTLDSIAGLPYRDCDSRYQCCSTQELLAASLFSVSPTLNFKDLAAHLQWEPHKLLRIRDIGCYGDVLMSDLSKTFRAPKCYSQVTEIA